jgi:hypothetical protein
MLYKQAIVSLFGLFLLQAAEARELQDTEEDANTYP